jgi:hypothetical protein
MGGVARGCGQVMVMVKRGGHAGGIGRRGPYGLG